MSISTKMSLTLFLISFNIYVVSSAKILAVYPTPSISHQIVYQILTLELVKRGHEVTVITTDPVYPKGRGPPNLIEIDVRDLSYKMWADGWMSDKSKSEADHLSQVNNIVRLMSKIIAAQLVSNKEIQEIINNKKSEYDLLIIEAYVKPVLIYSHIFKVPVIQINSAGGLSHNFKAVGAPTHPFLYPAIPTQRIYNLSNYEKLQEFYYKWRMENAFDEIEEEDNRSLQKLFGTDVPSIRELYNNVDLLFLNIHRIWTDNQPYPPNVIHIGGIHTHPPTKGLPKDLDLLMNNAKNGVIYFSLGTNVNTTNLPFDKIQVITKVFSQLPYDIIWKCNQDSIPGKTENVKLYKWVPQADLLKHPKIKLFITQAGLQSTDEAIEAGVPVIGIPIFGDQWYNAEKYQQLKIGIKLDLKDLTEEMFKGAIETVISDDSYRSNMKRMRKIIKDEPQTPLERAVWWVEYVLRHKGAKHLRAAGANISWTQYLELELVAIVVLFLLSILLIFFVTLYYIMKSLRAYSKVKTS
ncbi:UDP-glucosyltransferase 2 [Bicyclus anynana]|uniref:UDP-glucuronosyltransferase n=1 Tax=Bicyclus anynana TaxID=110368 RepID=A0A6J1MXF4_BICAN|nr:UDP-glucosyltransferase 2 [Bicyclus anynana]XP_023937627.2 UDP-glucosyltransferase 2 [Bicyclus anynana]